MTSSTRPIREASSTSTCAARPIPKEKFALSSLPEAPRLTRGGGEVSPPFPQGFEDGRGPPETHRSHLHPSHAAQLGARLHAHGARLGHAQDLARIHAPVPHDEEAHHAGHRRIGRDGGT